MQPNGFESPVQDDARYYNEPPRSGCRPIVFFFAGIGVLAVMCFVCCGGVFFGTTRMLKGQVQQAIQPNPVVQEHIGEIEDIDLDWVASMEAPEDVFVYELQGSKANATVEVITETVDADTEALISGKLRLPDGREFDLIPSDTTGTDPL